MKRMMRKTYSNVLVAAKAIQAKGYNERMSYKLAIQCFDEMEQNQNGMPVSWYIARIAIAE